VCFSIAFAGAAAPLLVLWAGASAAAPVVVMGLAATAFFFISIMLAGIYVYAPEIYPTHLRALGTGVATAWYRLAAIVSPTVVGVVLAGAGIGAVFLMLAAVALVGAAVVALFAVEMRGRPLQAA
jgi:putative MFS transporter